MAGDLATLTADAVLFVMLAVGAYGRSVLAKASEDVADASVKTGLKMLFTWSLGPRSHDEALPNVVAEVIDNLGGEDYLNQLKLAIRKALERDTALAEKVATMVAEGRPSQSVIQNI